jgi:hypothetical protein
MDVSLDLGGWAVPVPYGRMSGGGTYRVYALKYAERDARRAEHFIGGDPHDAPMPMDYFVWAIVGDDATWVVDTGFGADDADRRRRRLLRSSAEALATIGIDAATVTDVIITHLHYDHAGGIAPLPRARFHLQDREMAFATGRHMTRPALNTRSPPTTSPSWCTPSTAAGSYSTPATTSWPVGCRSTSSAVTPTASRSCGSAPGPAGWCWPPTPPTTTRTWPRAGRSRSCTTSAPWWRGGRRSPGWRRRPTPSCPATT